ncbi:unnamed protein product [Adineta ricciae]|uniref:Uncharacterized protein n=1 Tax=Adineta ricciae TaxID=249248 RepID=A0A816BN63_ADIRI|nr:unnamed protein product [Adineta ricciae]CAF1611316.1 unnamed protein product [Adineta ricciae]
MVLDGNLLKEKLVEAWKLRSNDRSFSASLAPLIAESQSEEEFRTIFTTEILNHIHSAISSNLLESYFKFHTRSGYIDEALVIQRLCSLTPTRRTDDVQIKFLIELLRETLKTLHITAEHAVRLGKQLNLLTKWFCSALTFYSNEQIETKDEEILLSICDLFLFIFTHATFYCLWLMTIKAQREQKEWKQNQEQVGQALKRIILQESHHKNIYEQVFFKINRLHLSEEFHQEDIEFSVSLFSPIVCLLVINKLHKCSSTFLTILRFYEHVSTTLNPHSTYLRFLQASFGGYLASVSSNNSEYQQRWSAYVHFQLPRIFASCLESQFDAVKHSLETFLLYNEYLLNRMDEMCVENTFEHFVQNVLTYVNDNVRMKNEDNINQLLAYIQRIRQPYNEHIQKFYQNHQSRSYTFQILQLQRSLEKSLHHIFSTPDDPQHLDILINNLTDFIPLICALDQYYNFIDLLLSYTKTRFDLALLLLCYVTSITDDTSEDFGQIEITADRSSPIFIVYIWLKKYWLSRYVGHALFGSTLSSTDLLSTMNNSFDEKSKVQKEEFATDVQCFNPENFAIKYSNTEYLSKTVLFLGDLQSLSLDETKQVVSQLINYLTHVSYGTLVHVLLWLVANYQIASDNERSWIQNTINTMGTETTDSTSMICSLFDAIKRQLWSDFIDNPLISYYSTIVPVSSSNLNYLVSSSIQTSTSLIQSLFDIYLLNEFLNCDQSRALYICTKYIPMNILIDRLIINMNMSNGIYETKRGLHFIFGLILFRRRSLTRCLLQEVFPYLFNMKSNEFMLEPNVYTTSLILCVLLTIEFQENTSESNDLAYVKPWKESNNAIKPTREDTSVFDAFHFFLNSSSDELFASETLRPVNYFFSWFQTILWMLSRQVNSLKPFVKPKLIAQISEFLPIQCPIEKVLSMLDLSTDEETTYASMVITRDYSNLQTNNRRKVSSLIQNPQFVMDEISLSKRTFDNVTKNIFYIPNNL